MMGCHTRMCEAQDKGNKKLIDEGSSICTLSRCGRLHEMAQMICEITLLLPG